MNRIFQTGPIHSKCCKLKFTLNLVCSSVSVTAEIYKDIYVYKYTHMHFLSAKGHDFSMQPRVLVMLELVISNVISLFSCYVSILKKY